MQFMVISDRHFWRRGAIILALIIGLGLGLTGCMAIPAAVKIASMAANGVSYLATGKSTSDHLLSGAMDRDCALHRTLSDQSVCKDNLPKETVLAASRLVASSAALGPVWNDPASRPANVQTIMNRHIQAFIDDNK